MPTNIYVVPGPAVVRSLIPGTNTNIGIANYSSVFVLDDVIAYGADICSSSSTDYET